MKTYAFNLGDRVQPTSGPYRRTIFEVVSVNGEQVSVQSANLKLAFRAKLLKFVPKSKVKREPQTTPATPLDQNGQVLKMGDRITPAWQSGKFVYYGIIESFSKAKAQGQWECGESFSVEPSKLIKVPKDGAWSPSPLTEGDAVSFEQYWNGNRQRFEGTITKLNDPVGTAIVHFEAPEATGLKELQASIGVFAKAKTPDNLSEVDSIRAEIAAIKAEGPIAPDNCWVDWKPQAGGFRQAVWRSSHAIFSAIRGAGMVKSSYIGKEGCPAHQAAKEAIARRNQIQKFEKRLKELESGNA